MFLRVLILLGIVFWGAISPVRADFLGTFQSDRDALAAKGFTFNINDIEDYITVYKGGSIDKDTWLGRIDLITEEDLEKAGLFKGGLIHLDLMSAHGGLKPTADGMVGDLQGVDDIEGPRSNRIYEAWYQQSLFENKFSVKFGLIDLNSEFLESDSGNLYINSAFAIAAGMYLPSNSVAIYPQPDPAVRLKYSPNDSWDFLAGFFQGNPLSPDDNPHSTHFGTNEGLLSIEEGQYHYKLPLGQGLAGTVKAGFWYNSTDVADVTSVDASGNPVTYGDDYGAYAMFDQAVFRVKDDEGLNIFFLGAGAPENRNEVEHSIAGGLNYKGLIPYRENDTTGFAVTSAVISEKLRVASGQEANETSYEWSYQAKINDYLSIQPDIQYVVHPSGDSNIKNASIFMLRTNISF